MGGKRISNDEPKENQNNRIKLDKETLLKNTLKSNTSSNITNQEIENF